MATPQLGASPLPGSLSSLDQFLAGKSEDAVRDGSQLERWCRQRQRDLPLFPLSLKKAFHLPYSAQGFFGAVEINGKPRSVMGCLQELSFGQVDTANAPERVREFALGQFLPRAHWTYEDGSPGGFTITQDLYRTPAGECGRFPAAERPGCVDWRDLGSRYTWVMHTMHVNDFVMEFGRIRKRLDEALCFVAHPDFVHVAEQPSEEIALDVSIGYPVVDYAPIPNVFGFGPGKFTAAVKLFSFLLTKTHELRIRMLFAAAPRCQKVFDFAKWCPDPVYGGARLLHYLSLGLWSDAGFHDYLDAGMLAQHCRVHQALMDGTYRIWSDWYPLRTGTAAAGPGAR